MGNEFVDHLFEVPKNLSQTFPSGAQTTVANVRVEEEFSRQILYRRTVAL